MTRLYHNYGIESIAQETEEGAFGYLVKEPGPFFFYGEITRCGQLDPRQVVNQVGYLKPIQVYNDATSLSRGCIQIMVYTPSSIKIASK